MSVPTPHGLPQILRVYGNPLDYVQDKRAWEDAVLETARLHTPLPYAYGPASIARIRGHKLVVQSVADALQACLDRGVAPERLAYGGMYCWRAQRGGTALSTHTWGIAVDLDPVNNPLGKAWDGGARMLPAPVIEEFERRGFVWGGRWGRPDVQHFQACDGY